MSGTLAALPPGSVVGVLGGGQLGRMLALAAAPLGLDVHIYAPEENPPAAAVARHATRAAYDDAAALKAFAAQVDVITYEFENVPAETAALLAALKPVRPGALALKVAQDRIAEKDFLSGLGLAVAPYAAVDDEPGARAAFAAIGAGRGAILKTRRMGYDGKGQARVGSADEAAAAATRLGAPCVLEGFVDFACEISVVAARGIDGAVVAFEPGENEHRDGILKYTRVPARIDAGQAQAARAMAGRILDALDYVGVIGVEMFVGADGTLLVNEIAPRVHNSGHWTQDGCAVSQFEQHIRAVAGWPLKAATRLADCEMENLIGAEAERWREIAAEPDAALHLYGKTQALPGRKMGHVNRLIGLKGDV